MNNCVNCAKKCIFIDENGCIKVPLSKLKYFVGEGITGYNNNILCDGLSYLIKTKVIPFPEVRNFATVPISELIQNDTSAVVFEASSGYDAEWPHFIKRPNQKFDGKEWILVFCYGDYEKLDVITDYFTGDIRNKCSMNGLPSPTEIFIIRADDVVKYAVERAIRTNTDMCSKYLYDAIYTMNTKQCKNFKVSVAMKIYDHFQAKITYDPCSGWGDRGIAAALSKSVQTYVGTDPNTHLSSGYNDISNFFKVHRPEKTIQYYHYPAEDIDLNSLFSEDSFKPDLIFTSPPFFDQEIYDNDATTRVTQSVVKHPTITDWYDNWFVKMTVRNWEILKPGGHLIYYLSNCGSPYNYGDKIVKSMANEDAVTNVLFRGRIPILNRKYKYPIFLYVWKKIA